MNTKTVDRAFTVLLCLVVVFVMIMAVTPLSFASSLGGNSTRTQLKTDGRRPYLTTYFYGLNSGMIDCKVSTGRWRRYVFDNTKVLVNALVSGGTAYLWFSPVSEDNTIMYYYDIGTSYNSFTGTSTWATVLVNETKEYPLNSTAPDIRYFNCGIDNGINGSQTITSTNNVYPYAYYPIMEQPTIDVQVIVDNQQSIADSQESQANSRASQQQSEDNSRQSQIMDAGSDITVSTIDNWIGGQDGLADKLTRLAETLSSNAYRFSQNQEQVSSKLAQAGNFVSGAFVKIPAPLVACMFCFLVILIAVKVIGR